MKSISPRWVVVDDRDRPGRRRAQDRGGAGERIRERKRQRLRILGVRILGDRDLDHLRGLAGGRAAVVHVSGERQRAVRLGVVGAGQGGPVGGRVVDRHVGVDGVAKGHGHRRGAVGLVDVVGRARQLNAGLRVVVVDDAEERGVDRRHAARERQVHGLVRLGGAVVRDVHLERLSGLAGREVESPGRGRVVRGRDSRGPVARRVVDGGGDVGRAGAINGDRRVTGQVVLLDEVRGRAEAERRHIVVVDRQHGRPVRADLRRGARGQILRVGEHEVHVLGALGVRVVRDRDLQGLRELAGVERKRLRRADRRVVADRRRRVDERRLGRVVDT